jgi:hypothetical protein
MISSRLDGESWAGKPMVMVKASARSSPSFFILSIYVADGIEGKYSGFECLLREKIFYGPTALCSFTFCWARDLS